MDISRKWCLGHLFLLRPNKKVYVFRVTWRIFWRVGRSENFIFHLFFILILTIISSNTKEWVQIKISDRRGQNNLVSGKYSVFKTLDRSVWFFSTLTVKFCQFCEDKSNWNWSKNKRFRQNSKISWKNNFC